MAVADVRADGTVHIYAHNQNPQMLRAQIATMLGISTGRLAQGAAPSATRGLNRASSIRAQY